MLCFANFRPAIITAGATTSWLAGSQENPDVSALHQYEYEIYVRRSPSGRSVGSSVLPAPSMCNVGKMLKTLEQLVFSMFVAIQAVVNLTA